MTPGANVMGTFIFDLLIIVTSLVIYPVMFGMFAMIFAQFEKKSISFMDGVKVVLSGHLIIVAVGIVVNLLTIVLTYLSSGFVNADLNKLSSTNPDEVFNLAGQGVGLGLAGACLGLFALAAMLWAFVVEIIGVKKVGNLSTVMAVVINVVVFTASVVISMIIGIFRPV